MNRLLYKILKRKKEKEYLNYIYNHKLNIEDAFMEMVMCPDLDWIGWDFYHTDLYERILEHDNSKYDKEEFNAYRKNYYPVDKEEKELNQDDFELAWKHHWESNRHHWQCRQYDICPDDKLTKSQILDCLENICDWLAIGYVKGDRPYQFYNQIKEEINIPKAEKDFMEKVIFKGIDKKYIK